MTRQGNPTGPKPGFARDDVVDAALALGIDRFTLSAVAQRLGVATSALYRTISSREDLLRACLERVAAATDFSDLSGPWQRVAHGYAEHLWQLLEEWPGLAGVLLSTPWAYQFFARPIADVRRAFIAGDLSDADAVLALDFIADTVIGAHFQAEVARGPAEEPEVHSAGAEAAPTTGLETARRRFEADGRAMQLPAALAPSADWLGRGRLDRKLEVIIRGLAGRGAVAASGTAAGDHRQ